MRPNRLVEVMRAGGPAACGWISMESTYLAEVLSYAGYDAVTVDLQHGMFGIDRAVALLQAVSAGPAVPLARCPGLDEATIGKLLDAGAYGIICPNIETAEQAARLVSACRYPPLGTRSFGPSRGLLYGGADYVRHADDTVLCLAMIESAPALDQLEAVLAVPGLDGVYVGPNDLAMSYGETPGLAEPGPLVAAALERVAAAARAAGRWAGVFCADVGTARRMAALGYHLITPGNDAGILRAAVAARIAALRGTAQDPAGNGGY